MPFDYTNDNLIESVKIRAMMPTSQVTFTEARILHLADEELQTVIFPMMMSTQGDYFLTNNDQTMTSERIYPIPSDAVGLKIKDCYWIDPNDGSERQHEITQVSIYDATAQYASGWVGMGFYLENNSVVLTPKSYPDKTLRQKYYKRASKLVPNSEGGQIVSIDTMANEVTLTNVPTTWAVGDLITCINQIPPFENIVTGVEIVAISSPIVEFTDVSDFSVDNWLCLDGDSTIAQITVEAHAILAQSVAVKCLEALADPNMPTAQAKFEQLRKNFIENMTPRVDGQAKVIVQRNGPLGWNLNTRWPRWTGW